MSCLITLNMMSRVHFFFSVRACGRLDNDRNWVEEGILAATVPEICVF